MFKIKAPDGTNNLCGQNVRLLRQEMKISQRKLAQQIQLMGYDVDQHFIRRIENGQRFVTDVELVLLCQFFNTTIDALVNPVGEKK